MGKNHPDIWRVKLVVKLPALEACEAALEGVVEVSSWFLDDPDADETDDNTDWCLEGFARVPPDRASLDAALAVAAASVGAPSPVMSIEQMPDTDWVLANLRDFPPISAGRFFVHGSHYDGVVPPGRIALRVDAGTAFGSGEHATTRGCLLAIDGLLRRRKIRHGLDLGCGSGILGIALAKATRRPVMAADIDATAARVARRNAASYRHPAIRRNRPYDLVLANILARPLVAMAADLGNHLAPGGFAVLSGLLVRQERLVMAAHRLAGLTLLGRVRIQGWSTLVLTRGPAIADVFCLGSRGAYVAVGAEPPAARPTAMAD